MDFESLNFDNRFAALPEEFYTKMPGEAFSKNPFLIHGNLAGAKLIGLNSKSFQKNDFVHYFSGNKKLIGSDSLAMVYSGHQFGQWAGKLGDGRALLLGQVRSNDGQLWDVQLKGSGMTPYSRMGDGRAVLRSCIREYLCGEALHGLEIATTRSLCIIGSGENVQREILEPGAIMTRLAESHIRFGHFEHFYYNKRNDLVTRLADYVIENHFPGLSYENWFEEVVHRTAKLVAQWTAIGFAHGVMNTDNMSVLGLTIDYGPFGFLDNFDPDFICNHSDHYGRYAFNQQPSVAFWNLQAFASTLNPLIPIETIEKILPKFEGTFVKTYHDLLAKKFGFIDYDTDDLKLCNAIFPLMQKHQADYTLSFRSLSELEKGMDPSTFLKHFNEDPAAAEWLKAYFEKVKKDADNRCQRMKSVNPKYILRNWIAETAIREAKQGNYKMIDQLLEIFKNPFDEHKEFENFASGPPEELCNLSISCSS